MAKRDRFRKFLTKGQLDDVRPVSCIKSNVCGLDRTRLKLICSGTTDTGRLSPSHGAAHSARIGPAFQYSRLQILGDGANASRFVGHVGEPLDIMAHRQ